MKKKTVKVIECFDCKGTGSVDVPATAGGPSWSHHCFCCHGTGFVKLKIKKKQAQIDPAF